MCWCNVECVMWCNVECCVMMWNVFHYHVVATHSTSHHTTLWWCGMCDGEFGVACGISTAVVWCGMGWYDVECVMMCSVQCCVLKCDRATFYIPSHNIPLCTTSHIPYQHILHLIPHHSTSHLPSPHYTSCTNRCHNAPHIAHHSHIIIHHGHITWRVCSSGVQYVVVWCGGEKCTSHIMPTHSTFHTTPLHITLHIMHQSLPRCTTLHITAT